jgi:tetratricopeptide (TPR) repeat protein
VIDQANTILLRQKLEDARAAAARGDLRGAAKLYEDAKALVDQIGSGINAETVQTISGLSATWLELARQAQRAGDLPEAAADVNRVLKVDPHNAAAIAFKRENDKIVSDLKGRIPDPATMERIPQVANDKTAAGTLVQDGKLLYEMGQFPEAEIKLNQALKLDPDNEGASYYLDLVRQANYAREEHNRTTQAQNSIVQVVKEWSPKMGIGLPVPNSYVTNTDVHTGVGREVLYRKLNNTRLDSISWSDGLPLSEVIRYLTEQSRLRDPDKKGINFIFNPNVRHPACLAAAPGAAPGL